VSPREVGVSHEVEAARGQGLLLCLLVDVELELDLFLPELRLEARILQFTLQGVDVGVRQRVGRQVVLDDVLGPDADVLGVGRREVLRGGAT